ncbi:MAG: VOC family protein [Candidatus Taylorbacteria bacterium]|nr:VOC family protein [Candidatus Taylorbacteria bacterium]
MKTVTPFLWFNTNAGEAAIFYTLIFKNSRIISQSIMMITFELEGQKFMALNGGIDFPFTEAISIYVDCDTQEEVDELWTKLSEGGSSGKCGWLKDKFGLSWQIIPKALSELLNGDDTDKTERVMEAMLQMTKIEIDTLKKAYNGGQ